MTLQIDAQTWARHCNDDGEFQLAARHWQGGLRLLVDDHPIELRIDNGQVEVGQASEGVIEYAAAEPVWREFFQVHPPRFRNDVMANLSTLQEIRRGGHDLVYAQYYAAAARALELLRPACTASDLLTDEPADFAAPVGRYANLNVAGVDYRVYFEEAGQGIPILLQHTAGCHGSQWRHLFEVPEITNRFRLIAYDLPFHGKSLPPSGVDWWAKPYDLKGDFLRAVPLALSQALALHNPVFMGCSVGGLLALDLAWQHADAFRAVIAVEGALHIEGDQAQLQELWHPQVSNGYKARLMEGLMSPQSPLAYRKETSFVYASGWPPVFLGDLYYYLHDFDLRDTAKQIDTKQVGVHILSGEYDYSGTSELGFQAHQAIDGSNWTEMKGVGHFPMSENPQAFIQYLMPVLQQIEG